MAKDDYFVIVYKILAYLYVKLKAGEDDDPQMLSHDSKLLQVNERYWAYIMENLQVQGYVRNLHIAHPWGNEILVSDLDYYGEYRKAEVHWFQEDTVGKVEFKVKRWADES